MAPPRSSNKENSPPTKRPRKTLLSAAASRARNAPLTGALSELPSQLPALPAPPPGHQKARTRSSTKAKQPPAFTVFTNETGATEHILDDADPTTSIIDERTIPDIVNRCCLTDDDLFSELTADDIRVLVERLLPDLQEEGVQEFLATIYDHACTSPPFLIPRRERHPSTWPLTYPDMDLAWGQAVEGEHAIELPETMDNWIDMSESNLVKPTGSLRDTLLIVSSYPTAKEDSTVHLSYGTTMDISNESMFMLYAKLGHHVSSIRHHGALHLDVFPRRVNRNIALGLGNIVDQVPTNLSMYWRLVVRQLIESSHSKVALLVGSAGIATYVAYLKANKIESKEMWVSGSNDHVHHTEHPSAWLEYDVNGNIRRIAFSVPHPEYLNRIRGTVVTDKVRANAIKERLVDYAMVLLWKDTNLQSFLSTAQYLWQLSNGLIVKTKDIKEYGEGNKALEQHLSIPTLNHSTLDNYMSRNKLGDVLTKTIKAMRNKVNTPFAKAHLFWDKPEAIQKYGNHTQTYKMLSERHQEGKRVSREKTKEKNANLPADEKKALTEHNKQKAIERKKRKQATKMIEKEEDMVQEEEKTEEER